MKTNQFIIYSATFEAFIQKKIEQIVYLQTSVVTKDHYATFRVIVSAFSTKATGIEPDRVHQLIVDGGSCLRNNDEEIERLSKICDDAETKIEEMLKEKNFIVCKEIISPEWVYSAETVQGILEGKKEKK